MSESEEMYLVTLARLNEAEGKDPTPVSRLAEELAVLPVSVNQMIHKLEESGLVKYTQYKGVTLTETGIRQANNILRSRRLWEVFLVERLHYIPDEAESLACRLEHAVSC
jgi:DtxR family Mn-dependent transcriptional regulator